MGMRLENRRTRDRLAPRKLALALSGASLLTLLVPGMGRAQTLPSGLTVARGQASFSTTNGQMTVVNSNNAILNWRNFSIGASNSVYFAQPDATSKVLNRVVGNDPSQILGRLGSNGRVWLLNPNGVLFGANARVDVAGLVASTLYIGDEDWMAGRYSFGPWQGAGSASIVNQGNLRTALGGHVALISASGVRNEGLIEAPDGQVILASGQAVDLIDTGTPHIAVRVTAPQGQAVNLGQILAQNGRVDVHAAVVNQDGIVRADSFRVGTAGEVILSASESVSTSERSQTTADGTTGGRVSIDSGTGTTLVEGRVSATGSNDVGGQVTLLGRQVGLVGQAQVDASGPLGGGAVLIGGGQRGQDPSVANAEAAYVGPDTRVSANASTAGDGGRVIVWSDRATRAYGSFEARGGAQSGNGGLIETSGGWLDARPASVNTSAPRGRAGQWLLDPNNITITSDSEAGDTLQPAQGPTFQTTGANAVIRTSTIATALQNNAEVRIETTATTPGIDSGQPGNITMAAATLLYPTNSQTVGTLILNADGDIRLSNSSVGPAVGLGSLNLTMQAKGDIEIQSSSFGLGSAGALRLAAGNDVTLSAVNTFFGATGLDIGAGRNIAIRDSFLFISDAPGAVSLIANSGSFSATNSSINAYGSLSIRASQGDVLIDNSNVFAADSLNLSARSVTIRSVPVADPVGCECSAPEVSSDGPIRISAGSVTLGVEARVRSLATGDAIAITGSQTGNTALNVTTFSNANTTTDAESLTESPNPLSAPNGRWLLFATDRSPANLTLGNLEQQWNFTQYNFRYSDATFSEGNIVARGAGNGLFFSAPRAVPLSGTPVKVYDASTAGSIAPSAVSLAAPQSEIDRIAVSGEGGDINGNFASPNAGAQTFVTDSAAISFFNGQRQIFGVTQSFAGRIDPRPLSLTNVSAASQTYNDTRDASVTVGGLSGLVGTQTLGVNATGLFADEHVGDNKPVQVSAVLSDGANGGLRNNYVLLPSAQQVTASITPATLTYVAQPTTRVVGSPSTPLPGTVTGLLGDDTLASATVGTLSFQAVGRTDVPGRVPVQGSGLSAQDYVFVQASGNATALTVTAVNIDPSREAVTALGDQQVVRLPASDPNVYGRTLDSVPAFQQGSSEGSLSFRTLSVESMSQQDLASILIARDEYKKALFGESLSRLERDPALADLPTCKTVREIDTGTCLLGDALKAEMRASADGRSRVGESALPTPALPAKPADPPTASPAPTARPTPSAQLPTPTLAARRGVRDAALPQIERKVALLIGVSRYADSRIPQLENSVGDVRAVAQLFESTLGYETIVLEDATREQIVATLNRLAADTGQRDSIIIYYAGHGALVPATGLGYWQPANADPKVPSTWISNSDVGKLISQFSASQVALISDSCYSGAFVSDNRIRASTGNMDPTAVLARKAAVVMSSGGNEPVFDSGKSGHSPFAWSLMQSLQQIPQWQAGGNVFERVRFAVARDLPQRPRYGALEQGGHQAGGDYLFEHRQLDSAR